MDELGFMNPPYMFVHFGKLTFPAFWSNLFFDQPVITHPPIHTMWIGLLGRLGLQIYYAEATPTVFLFLLSVVLIVRSAFPDAVKLGLLFSIGYVMAAGDTLAVCFGTRPEGELHAAWLCGLVLLESGRLSNWSLRSLAAGAFMLTWASAVHYYAGFAFAGVLVYVVWAILSLGWKEAKPRVVAVAAGGCLVGVPYVLFYLAPNFRSIQTAILDTQGPGGIVDSIRNHIAMYQGWANSEHPSLIRAAMSWRIPLLVYTTAILGTIKWTRGLAFAALPLQLFLFLFARHKLNPYLVHESALFAGAVAIGLLVLWVWIAGRAPRPIQKAFLPLSTMFLITALVARSPMLKSAVISEEPRIHEAEVARAAAREILGPGARVGGSWGEWYATGSTHFYNTQRDVQFRGLQFNPRAYASNLDAVADCPDYCVGAAGPSPSAWYADGAVTLRGFYFGETNDQLQFVLFSASPPQQLVGYASFHKQLYRFAAEPDGDYEVISAVCPIADDLGYYGWGRNWPGVFSSVLMIANGPLDSGRRLVTVLASRSPETEPVAWMTRVCRTVQNVPGILSLADKRAMVARLRGDDPPMHFYRHLDQVPGYKGVGLSPELIPPENAVRLDNGSTSRR